MRGEQYELFANLNAQWNAGSFQNADKSATGNLDIKKGCKGLGVEVACLIKGIVAACFPCDVWPDWLSDEF